MSKRKAAGSRPATSPPAPRPAQPLTTKRIVQTSFGIFAFALVVRLVHLWQMSGALFYELPISDCRQYDQWAQTVAAGDWLGSEVFYQTPLYPYLLAVIYVPFGHSLWAVRIVQALFGAAACVCIGRAGARFFNERVGIGAALLLAVYPPAIFFDGILQKASLDLLLMCGLLWVIAVAQDRRRWPWFAAAGVLLGATTLNRENAAALFPVLAGWIAWLSWPAWPRATLGWIAAFLAGAALVLVPVGARNYYVGGLFALTTSQMGPNFYIGNEARANGTYEALREGRGDPRYERTDARELAEQDLGRKLSPGEVSRYWMRRSWDDIRQDPLRWIKLLGWKWLLTWHKLEMTDSESMHTHAKFSTPLAVFTPIWHLGFVVPLAAVGIWYTRRDWRRLAALYAVIAAMALAVTIFYVFARYRYPLVPPLMLFASAAVWGTWDRLRGTVAMTMGEFATVIVIALAVGVPTNLKLTQAYDDDAVTFYNAANEFRNAGRLDDAMTLWEAALKADPGFDGPANNLGRAALAKGDLPLARRYFQRGLVALPNNGRIMFGLATLSAEEGDAAAARSQLIRAIQVMPALGPSLEVLAAGEEKLGRQKAAAVIRSVREQLVAATAESLVKSGMELAAKGQTRAALDAWKQALQLAPDMLSVANNVAWILATSPDDTLRNGRESIALAEAACKKTDYQQPALLDTLAAGYAEAGDYQQAVATCDKAIALATDPAQKEALLARKAVYASEEPFRDRSSPGPPATQP